MPDPILSIVAISAASGAAGGAAARLVERGVDAGITWIRDHIGRYGDDVRERAERNAAEFLIDLSTRVRRVEAELEKSGRVDVLKGHITSPDFTNTMQQALSAAARTSDRERHTILADLVASRLQKSDDTFDAIVDNLAVELVPRLSSVQLSFLGFQQSVRSLRQCEVGRSEDEAAYFQRRTRTIAQAFSDLNKLAPADLLHLASISVVRYGDGVIHWPLPTVLNEHNWRTLEPMTALNASPEGKWIVELWQRHAVNASVTVVGIVLGVHVSQARRADSRSSGAA